jgi:hypothetical protein
MFPCLAFSILVFLGKVEEMTQIDNQVAKQPMLPMNATSGVGVTQ